ncbi:hypothetical protein J2X97_000869 [Epilithonimonas hungarica]|nr:hypothetical protein [Epilithonimonas hungarica]
MIYGRIPLHFADAKSQTKMQAGRAIRYIFFVIANDVKQPVEPFSNRNNKKGCRYYPLRKKPAQQFVEWAFL